MAQEMYTPQRSPTLSARARGQDSASILLHDEEPGGNVTLNIEDEKAAKYGSPSTEESVATQIIDEEEVVTISNIKCFFE